MKMNKKLKEYSRKVYEVAKLQCDDDLDDADYFAVSTALAAVMFPSFQLTGIKYFDTGDIETSILFYLEAEGLDLGIELKLLNYLAQIFYNSYDIGIVYRESDLVDAIVAVCDDFKANGISELDDRLVERVIAPATNPFFTEKAYKKIKRDFYV